MAKSELQKAAARLMESITEEANARKPKTKALLKAISKDDGHDDHGRRASDN
jgi:hypothetical protein